MNEDLSCLRDPANETGAPSRRNDTLNFEGGRSYPIVKGIPRFVEPENYSDDFGAQWNMFPKTQLDSHTGLKVTETRLARCLHGNLEKLRGKKVLEAGSGAGRFTEVLLKYGAVVHSFDYSNAVEANARNNGGNPDLTLVQADIRQIPYPKGEYDFVVCLGVLQHTPDPQQSLRSLWKMLKPGGALVIDHYIWRWNQVLPPPIGGSVQAYRLLILRLPKRLRFGFVKALKTFFSRGTGGSGTASSSRGSCAGSRRSTSTTPT
jgi:SAM-dependent methyltransferase